MITTERIQQHKAMLSSETIPSLKTTASFDATFQFDTTNVVC